ncbi:MAG TPA: hypothetical protein PKW33_18890 [Anaerolineaceae bacterium]|nr:hypothetical protein [Anaerolineaceae bacterium]HPN53669.1 hypothetical protein [Anaerolineaceae bacterium]
MGRRRFDRSNRTLIILIVVSVIILVTTVTLLYIFNPQLVTESFTYLVNGLKAALLAVGQFFVNLWVSAVGLIGIK